MGTKVLSKDLQTQLLHVVASKLNPFQNPTLQRKTQVHFENNIQPSTPHLQQKYEELLDLDAEHIREILTPEERARLAGGFGATDDSVAHILMDAMQQQQGTTLQDIVNDGLSAAVRSGDYHTSRQLLILYSLVA
eukprot:CAMPEP_0118689910 /NCGR_PEP_ID=MMETSP0800-20121206/9766_1 /TAXON_ID=210618 ORGANISM="Striatella unipunctata, Strain CCMP2910" /NCGR_SAMPLE_ID=MMETSP0800 /ASSEMBLY_ACC=CAM_ASM_000638 /LENGTH=134 /DNA_ID=CAMNT_0006587389 /DNA_START=126 /DNA_END=527 /DNA_ORIENTATION=+